jgi:hypothetical protein
MCPRARRSITITKNPQGAKAAAASAAAVVSGLMVHYKGAAVGAGGRAY